MSSKRSFCARGGSAATRSGSGWTSGASIRWAMSTSGPVCHTSSARSFVRSDSSGCLSR